MVDLLQGTKQFFKLKKTTTTKYINNIYRFSQVNYY